MGTIRQMRESDVDAVRQVEAAAFGAWWRQLRGEDSDLPQRTRANIVSRLGRDPEGCFVAEEDDRVVGFIFSCTWGGVGWFGTFSVLPDYQGRGIGKGLIAASVAYLRQDPERLIGLETMPESPDNLGLYLRQGFQPRMLTLLMSRTLGEAEAAEPALPRWSLADAVTQERWLADLRDAAGRIQPRLDYTKPITLTARHHMGETLVLDDGPRAIGASTVMLSSIREGLGGERADAQPLFLHPDYTDADTLHMLLGASEALAHQHGKQTLTVSANARHPWAVEQLLGRGYQVERAMVRMVLKGTDEGPSTDSYVNLVRWAG